MANPRSVLLIISGSVAAYKALELIRLLRAQGVTVTAILTKSGAEFITPLAVSALTGTPTYHELFSLTDEIAMGHIQLSRMADVVLVAPASANILAKMAAGMADDLATTALLATNKPVLIAPAMNQQMWSHAATQRNIAQLQADGIAVIAPTSGDMACGETGIGRMAEPAAILDYLSHYAAPTNSGALTGKHAIVTSGPTVEAIDPVRYLGNRSSGKQGHAIAEALAKAGARVTLICGNVTLPSPAGVTTIHASNADAMLAAVHASLPADIFIGAAAVADWKMKTNENQKLKKKSSSDTLTLNLVPTVDILANIATCEQRPALVICFAAETEHLLDNARAKRLKKGCDWLVANDVSADQVFGTDTNHVTLITPAGEEEWPRASKADIAQQLVEKITAYFTEGYSA